MKKLKQQKRKQTNTILIPMPFHLSRSGKEEKQFFGTLLIHEDPDFGTLWGELCGRKTHCLADFSIARFLFSFLESF